MKNELQEEEERRIICPYRQVPTRHIFLRRLRDEKSSLSSRDSHRPRPYPRTFAALDIQLSLERSSHTPQIF